MFGASLVFASPPGANTCACPADAGGEIELPLPGHFCFWSLVLSRSSLRPFSSPLPPGNLHPGTTLRQRSRLQCLWLMTLGRALALGLGGGRKRGPGFLAALAWHLASATQSRDWEMLAAAPPGETQQPLAGEGWGLVIPVFLATGFDSHCSYWFSRFSWMNCFFICCMILGQFFFFLTSHGILTGQWVDSASSCLPGIDLCPFIIFHREQF